MKLKSFSISLILFPFLFSAPLICAQDKKTTKTRVVNALPIEVSNALKKGSFSNAISVIENQLNTLSANGNYESLKDNKTFVTLAMAFDILNGAGIDNVENLCKKDAKYARFLSVFLRNAAWMETYLTAGLIPTNSSVGLRVLADIWDSEKSPSDAIKYRFLSSGIAAAWGAGNFSRKLQAGEKVPSGNGRCDPVWRYHFFKKSHKAGKLVRNFSRLKSWEIRFVAGSVFDDASLVYTQKLINLPPSKYERACWRATYSGISPFGDTIQGPLYYTAAPISMGEAERIVTYGGVCGALSHVGSTSASAHGIPSFPEGQPGHCAYAYRPERGHWIGGFGGPDGGPHNAIFPGEAPTSVNMMESAFADDATVATAYKAVSFAKAFEKIGKLPEAKDAWEKALGLVPHNYNLQIEYQNFIKNHNLVTPVEWKKYAEKIISLYVGQGFGAVQVVSKIEDQFLKGLSSSEKLEYFNKVQLNLAKTKTSWATKLTPIIKSGFDYLKGDMDAQKKYFAMVMKIHMEIGDGTNFAQMLEWSVKEFVEKGQGEFFANSFKEAISSAGDTKIDPKKLKEAYSKAIISAENARSLAVFNIISEVAKDFRDGYRGPAADKLNCPAGELISDKGYLRLSSTSGYDRPCDHYNVLRKANGAFHTSEEALPYVIVALPQAYDLSGILIVKNDGNEGRSKHMKIYRSTDGATWFPIAESENTPKQWRTDYPEETMAKWVKIEIIVPRKEVFHLRNILIFKK